MAEQQKDAQGAAITGAHRDVAGSGTAAWRPALGALRLVGNGRSALHLAADATVQWWCAPDFDDAPLCWQLLDPRGGVAGFPDLVFVDSDSSPAAASATTQLRDEHGQLEVKDALLHREDGVLLVRLLRRLPTSRNPATGPGEVRHVLRLGGFDAPQVVFTASGRGARGTHRSRGRERQLHVRADHHEVVGEELHSVVRLLDGRWSALSIGIDVGDSDDSTPDEYVREVEEVDRAERNRLHTSRLPRSHPERAVDALAVLHACTYTPTGAVVASPTTSLPEAPGHDRQFDYRYTWLRDASLSTAVAALLGQSGDARRYLDFVHEAWDDGELLTRPLLDIRGDRVPEERDVPGVAGWAGSQPVRVGNDAADQKQYDAVGLLAEAVSVYLQVGGPLDDRTWDLVRGLADQVAGDHPEQAKRSNGIWEIREAKPLVDGDIGRWLVLDRALWIARGWRPWTRRRHWKKAREVIARRVLAAIGDDGLLPQAYGQDRSTPDASALMAVAFGLLGRDDPRAGRLVDAVLDRLGAGPHLYRYPPGGDDGFAGREGAFLPMSFLAVTALARVGRVDEARSRLDRLCEVLPRLLSEEVDPTTGHLLGNVPLVWSHAELARAIYVLDAAELRERWGAPALWAWRLQRYLRLRRDMPTGD